MRKPRDIDAELKALHDRQKQLRAKRTVQLGEIVAATGADSLDPETLAGALLAAIEALKGDASAKEAYRRRGEAFFRREKRARGSRANGTGDAAAGAASNLGGAAPSDGERQAG
ncbi:conjugal transfer protein TraD [Methylobacterium isbiliense]|jgi:hypothetical protein|uniref:Conjugal transfer protein TraD n=1 Tax=Methylobacterium isbiliense TaxID=315478 RepID=A0ABQ4SK32_9HYPH|nr:conjugal transfer protein TraD [Methylobacterium isbiliense]MDN3627382.1 conjugal transfer protein TraD [Methylobacterium isbiliense]GJE02031.1 hypothetical protein GMJLKIPL_3975 [Methylobacterium isbiliense]